MGEEKSFLRREDGGRREGRASVNSISAMEPSEIHKRARVENAEVPRAERCGMTPGAAAAKILAFIRKHPGVSHGDISSALSMRRQARQHAHRLLVQSGRIFGTLRGDGKTLEWRPREPHHPEPVQEPRRGPGSEAVTVSAPVAPFSSVTKVQTLDAAHPVPESPPPTVLDDDAVVECANAEAVAEDDGFGIKTYPLDI